MTVFWSVAALVLLGVLLLLLPALLSRSRDERGLTSASAAVAVYRDQWQETERDLAAGWVAAAQIEQVRADIQRRVLEEAAAATPAVHAGSPSRGMAAALGVAICVGSVVTYLLLGDPAAVQPPVATAPAPTTGAAAGRHAMSPEQIQAMVTGLAERLKQDPNNAEGWAMLGRSYTVLGRYQDAATALRRAGDLVPGNATLLADHADVLAMAQGRRLAGEPTRLIQAALDADPRHVKALALAGSAAFEARDYAAAQSFWERLLAVIPPQSDMARSIQGSVAQARQLEAGAAGMPTQVAAATPMAASAAIDGRVELADGMAQRVQPGDTLFVFARAVDGPRMPLAIVRRPVGEWPATFTLDDSTAMAPQFKLSGFRQVVVGVRISRSGSATASPGDLVGQSTPMAPGARGVRVVVDRIEP